MAQETPRPISVSNILEIHDDVTGRCVAVEAAVTRDLSRQV